MRPGVLERLGLGYEDLKKVKPDIIMLSSSAVGGTGPERLYTGYAPTFAAMGGMAYITGRVGGKPAPLMGTIDLRVGSTGTFAVLAALYHRKLTGEGQHIDLSSAEAVSALMGDAFMDYTMNHRVQERMGNRDRAMAPHAVYRCRDNKWVSIAVGGEDGVAGALRRHRRRAPDQRRPFRRRLPSLAEPGGAGRHHQRMDGRAHARRGDGGATGGRRRGDARLRRRGDRDGPARAGSAASSKRSSTR